MAVPQLTVLLLGTCDTKLSELLYLRSQIKQHGVSPKLMDVGRTAASHPDIDYPQSEILSLLSPRPPLETLDRSEVINTMISAATSFTHQLHSQGTIDGAICIGGSGGTSLGASVLRSALPVGFPKLLVSTVASGNVGNFVGATDITMMYSVVDIAGQNSILNPILENAAGMIAGAAKAYQARSQQQAKCAADHGRREEKKKIAITMFGVTTPAVDAARAELEGSGYEVFVFHATGVGGRAMENLISQGRIDGVLDLTTSELADELVGGTMSAGPDRLTAAAKLGIPQAVSLGGLDIVNFGPRDTVPERFVRGDRTLHQHNPDITIVRTTVEECRTLGERLAERLKTQAEHPNLVRVFIPCGGISMISMPGGVFCDKTADEALFEAVLVGLNDTEITVIKDERAINDKMFAISMARWLMSAMEDESTK